MSTHTCLYDGSELPESVESVIVDDGCTSLPPIPTPIPDSAIPSTFGKLERIGGKQFRIQEYWVVITATLLKLNEAKETAELDLYTKWFWHDNDFLDRIRLGQSHLEGKPPGDLVGAFGTGKRVSGCWPDGSTCAFPVNIEKMFHNQVGEYKRHSAWTRFQDGDVSVQHGFVVTVKYEASTGRYPFDLITVPLRLNRRESKSKENLTTGLCKVSATWRLMENHHLSPKDPEYKEDAYPVNSKKSPLQFLDTLKPQLGSELTEKEETGLLTIAEKDELRLHNRRFHPIPCLLFYRNPSHFMWNVVLPLFLIVLGCLSVLLLDVYAFNTIRFDSMLTGLLTVAVYKASIQKDLPVTPKLTIADAYILFCFVVLLCALAKLLIVAHINGSGSGRFIHPDDDWELTHRAMVVDDITTWVLIGVWILIHVVLLFLLLAGKCLREPLGKRVELVRSDITINCETLEVPTPPYAGNNKKTCKPCLRRRPAGTSP